MTTITTNGLLIKTGLETYDDATPVEQMHAIHEAILMLRMFHGYEWQSGAWRPPHNEKAA